MTVIGIPSVAEGIAKRSAVAQEFGDIVAHAEQADGAFQAQFGDLLLQRRAHRPVADDGQLERESGIQQPPHRREQHVVPFLRREASDADQRGLSRAPLRLGRTEPLHVRAVVNHAGALRGKPSEPRGGLADLVRHGGEMVHERDGHPFEQRRPPAAAIDRRRGVARADDDRHARQPRGRHAVDRRHAIVAVQHFHAPPPERPGEARRRRRGPARAPPRNRPRASRSRPAGSAAPSRRSASAQSRSARTGRGARERPARARGTRRLRH